MHITELYQFADFVPKPASCPTSAPAGSTEKIAILRLRVQRGEHLYHPMDNTEQARPAMRGSYQPGIRELAGR